mmetsp:Transcript_107343/g.300608  ORF Transcript_107343/g.300608 Transcript_107343/m.300608 type:complete len:358 (-) Transcript_107343:271-1344(-)
MPRGVRRRGGQDRVHVRLDGHREVLGDAAQGVGPRRGDLRGHDLQVVVVLPVDEGDEAERARVGVHLLLPALVGHAIHAVEAPEEVPEAVVAVQCVAARHERRGILLGCVGDGLGEHSATQYAREEVLVVVACGEEAPSEVRALAHVEAVAHLVRHQQVLANDIVDAKARRRHGDRRCDLQVVRVVRIDLARGPNELHIIIDGLRALRDVARGHVALRGVLRADVCGQPLLQGRGGRLRPGRRAPLAGRPGVGLLAGVPVPEARGEAEQHAEGHRGAGVLRVLCPPGEVVVDGVVQALDRAIAHEPREQHRRRPLARAACGDHGAHLELAALVEEQPPVLRRANGDGVVLRELPTVE